MLLKIVQLRETSLKMFQQMGLVSDERLDEPNNYFFFGLLRKVDPVLSAGIPAQQWWVYTESAHEAPIIPLVGRRFFRISATIDEC